MTGPRADQHQPTSGHTPDPASGEAATPAWMQMSTRPLEAALAGTGQEHIGVAATLWPTGQHSDATHRAGRYPSDTIRHPQRTRAASTAHVIDRYSQPGQVVFDGFVGAGTTLVEAAYAGRHSIGVDQNIRRVDRATRNVAFAHQQGATGNALVVYADTRDLHPILRRLRHRVDLVLTTPPAQFKPTTAVSVRDHAAVVANLEHDMKLAIHNWIPLLHAATTLVFTTRLRPGPGYHLDLSVAIAAAAQWAGLQLVERAAALRVPVRDASPRGRSIPARTRGRGPTPVVHDDVLIYRLATAAPKRWRGR